MFETYFYPFIKDMEKLHAYLDFCLRQESLVGTERHHIIPKSICPELKQEAWNIVILSTEDHVNAHKLLKDAISHRGMLYAYHMMSLTRKINPESAPHEAIVEINRGRKHTEEFREKVSSRMRGTTTYRSPSGVVRRFRIDQHPEGWVHSLTGRTHTEETKKKISENRTPAYCSEELKDKLSKYAKKRFSGKVFVSTNGVQKRVSVEEIGPNDVVGRTNFGPSGNPFGGKISLKSCIDGSNLVTDTKPEYYVNPAVKRIL